MQIHPFSLRSGPAKRGVPGVPGAADLEAALRRLSPAEVLARRANLQLGPTYGGYEGDCYQPPLPYGCRTPDSLMSTGSGCYPTWKLPEKLQIVKPMEGSQTLHHWSQLAQPTFGGLLEERPGVKIRGGKELEDIGWVLRSTHIASVPHVRTDESAAMLHFKQ